MAGGECTHRLHVAAFINGLCGHRLAEGIDRFDDGKSIAQRPCEIG